MTFWQHMVWSAFGAACPALLIANCGDLPRYDPKVQCPRAVKNGITGPGLTPCAIQGARDRLQEFKRETKIAATCTGDESLSCNGVTASGEPVKFKCDSRRCEHIARWRW